MKFRTKKQTRSAIGIALLIVLYGCSGDKIPEITAGIDGCALCNMTIDQVNQACGFYWANEFVVFDSPGCLLRNMGTIKSESGRLPSRIYFADYNTSRLVPADSTTFLLTEHLPTVMNAGVLCFADRNVADTMQQHPDEIVTDWIGYWTQRGVPDRIVEIMVSNNGFNPDVIMLNKGELIEWIVRSDGLKSDLRFKVEGYPEVGEITVPSSGEKVTFRMLATRPGAGFPLVRINDGKPLGMVKVAGAHTEDEEAM